jgi:GTP pyrophosphokinase
MPDAPDLSVVIPAANSVQPQTPHTSTRLADAASQARSTANGGHARESSLDYSEGSPLDGNGTEEVAVSMFPLSEESIEVLDEENALATAAPHGEEIARAQVRTLIEHTQQARPSSDADLLERAYAFAHEQHEGQKRMTGEPYIEHPIAVAGILAELGMDDTSIAAGFLHDVTEDCGVTHEELTQRFGVDVAYLVDGVTKLKKLEFSSQQEKQAENLRKLFLAMSNDVRVIIIKLADRLHNMRTLDPFPEKRKREIAAETLQILAPIAHRLGIWRVKWELEDRSFKYLEPDAYRQIHAWVQRTRADRNNAVQRAIDDLQEQLKARHITAEVSGRPKHFYSIYQKMLKQGLRFDQIADLTAMRVICQSEDDCYRVLGIVNGLWLTVPGMFFDYIAQPKPNNYRSIHTKVLDSHGELLEVQIRTREMHREAEYGIAAHWRYKGESAGKDSKIFGDKLNWLRMVLELQHETVGDAEGFLDSLKLDLGSDQIFAFTPKGDVVYLPQGSSPIDFAYRIHSEIGNRCIGAKVNGRIVPLNYKLHNGDICEITTSRASKGPKRGWLEFVLTSHAKNRIKNFLRKQSHDENYREGLMRLEKTAQAERLKLGAIADNESLLRYAKLQNLKSVEELIAAIGYGEYSAESVLNRIRTELKQVRPDKKDKSLVGEVHDTLSGTATSLLSERAKRRMNRGRDEDGEAQKGHLRFRREKDAPAQDDLLYTIARCCAPIAGDAVKGYITRGRGISVHRVNCANLKNYEEREPQRLLEAEWVDDKGEYQVLVAVESDDRVGLLHDVTSVMAERHVNICGVNTYPLKNKRARLNLAVTINGVGQLDEIVNVLKTVPGVTKVHRV